MDLASKKKKTRLGKMLAFLQVDVWRIPHHQLSSQKYFLIRQLRVVILAIRGFIEDRIQLRASALTFYTLLAIIPAVAFIFGIAQGFGFERNLEKLLEDNLAVQKEVLDFIITTAHNLLENTKGGFIAGAGLFIFLFAFINILSSMEGAFNDIWQIRRGRNYVRKFSDYLSLVIVVPLIVIISSSASVYLSTTVKSIADGGADYQYISPMLYFLLKILPYLLIWFLFTIIYLIVPNTRVNFRAALIGGIIGGTIFQFLQWFYLHFQIQISQYNPLYGGFAAFPLFIIFLNISWIIVLFGAEMSFASQNVHQFEFEADTRNISPSFKKLLTLLIAQKVVKHFEQGKKPLTAPQISLELGIPIRLTWHIVNEMVQGGLLIEIDGQDKEEKSYTPAVDINRISIAYVLYKLEEPGSKNIYVRESDEYKKIAERYKQLQGSIEKSDANVLLKDI